MNHSLARMISFLGHPLLVLTYMLLLMLIINPFAFGAHHIGDQRTVILFFYVVSTTFLIPGLGVSLLKPLGLVQSLEMRDKQERIGPYIITGIFYLWMFKNFTNGAVPELFAKFVLGATIGLFFAFFVNIFTKISAHATGMGGFIGMVLLLAFEWSGSTFGLGPILLSLNAILAVVILLAGLVGMARLSLGGHTQADLWQGYVAGFVAVMLAEVIL
ncbi:MAG: hypothetical protein Q7T20_05165 [Saprospiraceae bacterium]|nr:hypothetical protein [Saprospiraceae bacterium]